jgi:hypothetical protein
VGADPHIWSQLLFDNPMVFTGRVAEEESSRYLATTQLSSNKDLVVVAMTPSDKREDKESFEKLIAFLISRK